MRARTLLWLTLFAVAMAYVEAALVVHLRHLYYAENPLAIFPLQLLSHADLGIELAREAATLIMILSVALLAERTTSRRFAAGVYVFGVWDLGYYACLKLLIDWPQTWLEWDVLFLIPWPWLGPWLAPAVIALLFAVWGARALLSGISPAFTRRRILLFLLGAALGLSAFLWPGAQLLPGGEAAFKGYQPAGFPWIVYIAGLACMTLSLFMGSREQTDRQ
ncbi:MAG: hypothetical protein OEN52_03960 [Gammaproteobacteria bacterium]|nr:hypothetical protein [Gammaproteobacteria bacterium]